jgi:phage replication-related protein YjqB (UPF0714/DUF867 family)
VDEMASYISFKELADREVEGRDYRIRMEFRDPNVLVMALHGGNIEPATAEIAKAIAGTTYSFYAFEGLKADGDRPLHIESHLFDEPYALKVVGEADVVLTVHGQIGQKDEFVMVGGLNDDLRRGIAQQLEWAGFKTRPPTEGLMGTDPLNICNRGKSKQGVQLEISRKLRNQFKNNKDHLQIFANVVRRAIQTYLSRRSG